MKVSCKHSVLRELYICVLPLFLNINQLDALNFIISLFQASTCFEHMCSSYGTATYRCDDTRDCIIHFCPPDDEHMCSKHVEAWNKLIIKFSASSWLILINKYIEMQGQQNIKISLCLYTKAIQHKRKTARLAGTDFTSFVSVRRQHGGKDKLKYDDWGGSAPPLLIRIFSIKLSSLKSVWAGGAFSSRKSFVIFFKKFKLVYTIFSLTTCFDLLNRSKQ